MIIVMKRGASARELAAVVGQMEEQGYRVRISHGEEHTTIGVIGDGHPLEREEIEQMDGVERTVPILQPFKLASREFHPQDTVVVVNGVPIGGKQLVVMAGPCAVENREQLLEAARAVKQAGGHFLRGGAFKPRTSPYSFQGFGEQGLQWLAEARDVTGLPVVTEVMEPGLVPLVCQYADVLQIGARNMQNFSLLREVGKVNKPILLKRGMDSMLKEWLNCAEYILAEGNPNVILCERGIRTFETYTRNNLHEILSSH